MRWYVKTFAKLAQMSEGRKEHMQFYSQTLAHISNDIQAYTSQNGYDSPCINTYKKSHNLPQQTASADALWF